MFLSTICALVERAGARLVGADTVVDLDDLSVASPRWLVVDLDDTDNDVVDAIQAVHAALPLLGLVVLTRAPEAARVAALVDRGAYAVIDKRLPPEDVERRVRAAFTGERVLDADDAVDGGR